MMSLKVQGTPTFSTIQSTDNVGINPATPSSAALIQGMTPQNEFRVGQEITAQAETSANFVQASTTKISSGMNLLHLQIAEGTNGVTPQAPMVPTQVVSQTVAPQVQTATPVQKVTDPAELERQRNAETVTQFYTAMQKGDFDTIMSLYHPDAKFSDPAYPNLKGDKLKGMWTLITNAKPEVTFRDVKANKDGTVTGHWDANYEIIKGNPIHNSIDSTFVFKDGKIIQHTDNFDFSKWADQAFPGILGKLAGTSVGHWVMQKIILPFTI